MWAQQRGPGRCRRRRVTTFGHRQYFAGGLAATDLDGRPIQPVCHQNTGGQGRRRQAAGQTVLLSRRLAVYTKPSTHPSTNSFDHPSVRPSVHHTILATMIPPRLAISQATRSCRPVPRFLPNCGCVCLLP